MSWGVREYRPEEPGILMPGLVLSKVRLESYETPDVDYRFFQINGVQYGYPWWDIEMGEFYQAVLQAFNAGQSIYWERRTDSPGGPLLTIGDVVRFFITNLTPDPIGLPLQWSHDGLQVAGYSWVELGRFVWVGEECTRETAITFTPPDPNMLSWSGVLYIPPGEWDLNTAMGSRAYWEGPSWQYGYSRSTLRMLQALPDDDSPRRRRRRAAWQNLERPAFF